MFHKKSKKEKRASQKEEDYIPKAFRKEKSRGRDKEKLKSLYENKLTSNGCGASYNLLLDNIFMYPFISITDVADMLHISHPTASKMIDTFCNFGILIDITPNQKRNKRYAFSTYLEILNRGTELL